jgi:hypothetical protein
MRANRKVFNNKELCDRLIHMGLLTEKGAVNHDAMAAFANMFFGLFLWDIKHCNGKKKELLNLAYDGFKELNQRNDYEHMYLLLSMQYDNMGKPLPDPVWWLMCSDTAVLGFMERFMSCFEAHMTNCGQHDQDLGEEESS